MMVKYVSRSLVYLELALFFQEGIEKRVEKLNRLAYN